MFKGKFYVIDYLLFISVYVNFVGIIIDIFVVLFCLNGDISMFYDWIVNIGVFDYMLFYFILFYGIKDLFKFI